jgi:Fe-S cluster assembly protein SufD
MTLAAAIRSRDVSTLPSRRDEGWRWSELASVVRTAPPLAEAISVAPGGGPFADIAADEERVFANGQGDVSPLVVEGKRTVKLRFVTRADAAASLSAISIVVKSGADLTLLESYEGEGVAYVADAALDIQLEDGARLERIVVADDSETAVSLSTAHVALSPNAAFAQAVFATGAKRQRIETRVQHPGAGASVRMDGVYLVGQHRHADLTTAVIHAGVDGTTSQMIKGVAADHGRGVFQGLIRVEHGADRTDARMRHDALLLSDKAEIDAKPELEIFADDVSCAHGNTVGALDDAAIFYARQRGLPLHEARVLLTEAFVGAVVERIEHPGAREALAALVPLKLEALTC